MNLLFAFAASLALGMRHATDADHLVAVSTIVSRERTLRSAARIGALWGLGHTLTIFAVGGAIVIFKLIVTPRVGLSLELCVAAMLIVLGVLNLLDVRPSSARAALARPFLIGTVHGLAGSAAATLLIIPLIPDPRWALLYLVVFGAGTIAGMALMTIAIAAPAAYAAARVARVEKGIRITSGALSLAFGLMLAVKIGLVNGLLSGTHALP